MNSFSALKSTEPVMEIICSLTFITLLQMVPPWALLNDINRAYSGEKLEVEEYTSYDLALDNRDALAGDAYKNAENYYKSVFEHAGGSISFYPDKSGAAQPQRCIIVRPVSSPYRM